MSLSGDSLAACRISSEYAADAARCGSVSARQGGRAAKAVGPRRLTPPDRGRKRGPRCETDRRALLRARFSQEQRAVIERERSLDDFGAHAEHPPGVTPSQAASDHQMDDEKQVLVKCEHDSFAETADSFHCPSGNGLDGRIDRAQDERAAQVDLLEDAAADFRRQRFDVDRHVRQFRHRRILPFAFGASFERRKPKEYRCRLKVMAEVAPVVALLRAGEALSM